MVSILVFYNVVDAHLHGHCCILARPQYKKCSPQPQNPKHKNQWHFIHWRFVRGIMTGYPTQYTIAINLHNIIAKNLPNLTIQYYRLLAKKHDINSMRKRQLG